MANQPKKYPYPEKSSHFHSQAALEEMQKAWRNGYDCKKCGNEFVAFLDESPLPKPKKKFSIIKTLFWALILLVGFMTYISVTHEDKRIKANQQKTESNSNRINDSDIQNAVEAEQKEREKAH